MTRVGFGKDIHPLVKGRKLILGGIVIDSAFGEKATSDGDVVLHALSDAILGALGLGDIGEYFPSSDPKCKDMNSKVILDFVLNKMKDKGFVIENIDVSIELESPHISLQKPQILENIAKYCEIAREFINVKAMSNEGFDAVGQGKAVCAYVVCLLKKE
jgi:2-C-methyl-D-erythritol 2,4-cyclodiphosphate synthase